MWTETANRAFGWRDASALDSHRYLLPRVLREVNRATQGKAARLLDLGCGNGHVANELARQGHEVLGVDQAPDGIAIARAAFARVRFELLCLEQSSLSEIVGAPVDGIISLEVIEHLFSPERLFTQSMPLLKPRGFVILSTPYHGFVKNLAISLMNGWDRHFAVEHEGGHIKFFSPASLTRMAEASGFRRVRWFGAGRVPLLWKSMIFVFEKP